MLKIIFLILVVCIGLTVISSRTPQPPLRGMIRQPGSAQPILLSRARPAVTFSLDAQLSLLTAGWCDIHPESRHSIDGDARLWLAVYGHRRGLAVTAVGDGIDLWQWEAGDHAAYLPIRSQRVPAGKFSIFETITVLDHRRDPFCGAATAGANSGETRACLVYRAKMILEFDKTQVIAEYHEDLPEDIAQDVAFAHDWLNDFSRRARNAVQPVLLQKEEARALTADMEKLGTLDKAVSRRSLAVWTGRMHRRGHM